MPFIPSPIVFGSGHPSADTIKQLQKELASNGFAVSATETASSQYGPDTQAGIKAFQERYALPVTGNLDPATGGILALASQVSAETDKAKLRAALRAAVNKVPNSPQYNYWLARYSLMAGDYALAAKVSPHLNDLSGLAVNLGDVFDTGDTGGSPQAPDVPFPENFYSYRQSLIAQDDIIALRNHRTQFMSGVPRYADARKPVSHTDSGIAMYDPTPLPPGAPPDQSRKERLADSAEAFLAALEAWQLGNSEFQAQRYASAIDAYDRCQQATLDYFSLYPDYNFQFPAGTLSNAMDTLIWRLVSDGQGWADLWKQINWRRQLLSLAELRQFDWTPAMTPAFIINQLLQGNMAGNDQPPPPTNPIGPTHRKVLMDARIIVISAVLVPLARGEANRLRRQYALAVADFSRVLRNSVPVPNSPTLRAPAILRCQFIEDPFTRLLMMETMLDQAEAQYKGRVRVEDEPDDALRAQELTRIGQIAQDFQSRQIPGDTSPGALPLQHLAAALTYAGILDAVRDDGNYVANTRQALTSLNSSVTTAVHSGDVTSLAFRSLAHRMTVPTISAVGSALPGSTSGTHPHEPYLKFDSPDSQPMRERNPRVYALLLQAQARLLQIWNGFNYLGYRDDYVPPWRFQYLLERARYFSEHAKNAQRDYLNFLNNAENEEFKEMSAAQNVELEKANVQIETARVDQATKEVAASQESANLATLQAADAQTRLDHYSEFVDMANRLLGTGDFNAIAHLTDALNGIPVLGSTLETIASDTFDVFTGGASDRAKQNAVAAAQRALERDNLRLAVAEANQAAKVAQAHLAASQAGLVVAGLQRQAALLRHEFALQSLQFMRNRSLNSEQWYRLAAAIRSLGDSYLRYAIEIAFLAQQAYNFEADNRLQVIRFDYDLSDVGSMLAADFLLRDLDTLEQDLVTSQQDRQQQVRYVLSMARDYPDALQRLAEDGKVSLSVRLEQLEKHFPGLVNMRISSLDLLPVALMDPAAFTVQLTQTGSGSVRLKAQPGTSPLNSSDLPANVDWVPNAGTNWPVKVQVSPTETAVFSGLSRIDMAGLSPINANERVAFEGLPGASNWRIDMSMKENRIVPGTLVDVLITFTLSGFFDSQWSAAVLAAASGQRPPVSTSMVSARRTLPDAYYSLAQYGKLDWNVSAAMLNPSGRPGALRNVAVFLQLSQDPAAADFGRCRCGYTIEFEVSSAGTIQPVTLLPTFTLTLDKLAVHCSYTGTATATWDFGDGSPLATGATVQHRYAQPGRYEVLARLVKDGRLDEYRSLVYVSQNQAVVPPLIVAPALSLSGADLTVSADPALGLDCTIGSTRSFGSAGSAKLSGITKGARYRMSFTAMRRLSAYFYGKQRYLPADIVDLDRLRAATNRTFDGSGAETTTSPNAFTSHVFGPQTLAPDDRWTLELPLDKNPWFVGVSSSDIPQFSGEELTDAIIAFEFAES